MSVFNQPSNETKRNDTFGETNLSTINVESEHEIRFLLCLNFVMSLVVTHQFPPSPHNVLEQQLDDMSQRLDFGKRPLRVKWLSVSDDCVMKKTGW
jgi:hypothetical protein